MKLGLRLGIDSAGGGISYTPEAKAIFAKMVELNEEPNTLTKLAYNNAIIALKTNSLWDICDYIESHRSHAENSSFINWKTGLVQGSKQKTTGDYPTFTINSGWLTNGTDNFLNTGCNLSTGTNYTLNDAGFIFKTAKADGDSAYSLGAYASTSSRMYLIKRAVGSSTQGGINGAAATFTGLGDASSNKAGYYGIVRKSSTLIAAMKDDAIVDDISNTGAADLINKDVYIGRWNNATPGYTSEQSELIAFSSKFTQSQFLKFQDIFNQFFYELDIALAEDVMLHGAVGDGVTDDHAAIMSTLAAYNSIKIGDSRTNKFLISKEIAIPSNKTVVINGDLKIKDGTITTITQNVALNSTQIYVNSVVGFNVGELVGWSDDLMEVQGGGVQTRKVGGCAYITDIDTENKLITVDYGSPYAIAAASNAVLGHYQNVIKIDIASKNINIYGDGIIDGNMLTQLDIEGVYNHAAISEFGASGIFIRQCNKIRIQGKNQLEILNNALHGIAFLGTTNYQSKNIIVDKVKSHLNHDKNILFYYTDISSVSNCIGDDSLFEDGLMYYALNTNAAISNVSCNNNRRGGLYMNGNPNLLLLGTGINLSGNKFYDLVINSTNVTLNNVNITGISTIEQRYSVWISSFYEYGDNIEINNLAINGIINPDYAVVGLIGELSNIDITNLTLNNCNGVGILATDGGLGGFPQTVIIEDGGIYNHTGTKTDIQAGSDVTFTDFDGLI